MAGRRTTRDRSDLIVYGLNAALGAIAHAVEAVTQVCVTDGPKQPALWSALSSVGLRATVLSEAEMSRLAGGARHQGVVVRMRSFPYCGLDDVVGSPGRGVLVLDGIMDPRNVGAMLRSAAAAGVRGAVVPRDRIAPISAATVSASAGTAFQVRVAQVTNVTRALEDLKEAGMWSVGLSAATERTIADVPTLEEPAIVVGSEGDGLRRLVREECDFLARIPMAPGIESLNASVAVGIAVYELLLRRRDTV